MRRKDTKNNAKHWFWTGAIIVGLALLLFVGFFFFNGWMQRKLERMVHKQTNGIYTLHLLGFQASPFTGTLSIDSIALEPDLNRWEQLEKQDTKAPAMLVEITSGPLALRGLNYSRMLFREGLGMHLLRLQHPNITLLQMKQDSSQQSKQPLYKSLKGMLQGMRIDRIDVNRGMLQYKQKPDEKIPTFKVQQFSLVVEDMQLDSAAFVAKDRAYYARKIELNAEKTHFLPPGSFSRLTIDSIQLSTAKHNLLATSLVLQPTGSAAELSRAKGQATSYTKVTIDRVALSGVNYEAHSRSHTYVVGKAVINSPHLNSFKDKKNFRDSGDKNPLPHQLMQQMKQQFLVDTVQIRNGYIRYAELVPQATKRGYITMENLYATATNLTNIPGHISHKNPAVIEAKMKVMGKAPLSFTIRMPLLDKNGYHTISGSIGESEPEILNPILAPTTFISVESGHIRSGQFNITLTNDHADGTMKLLYSNLEVELLSKGKGERQSLGKEILSEIANWVAIKSSNPEDKGEQPRIGDITVTRNPQKTIFSYWKDCIASGFLSSMGLEKKSNK
ncbi:hypothetical protein [Pontibacter chitinilyticus]|uniref:hypothetical protein n=1 Tax=Pontibacter chitinilyticus TaxID=2674989 RepID=UPI00321B8F4E